MKLEFDIKNTEKDFFAFNMHHTYRSSQGIMSIVLAAIVTFVVVYTWGNMEPYFSLILIFAAILCIVYVPMTLKGKAKATVKRGNGYDNTIHYIFDEEGVTTSIGEQSASLQWKLMYKIYSNKKYVYIFQNRLAANIIPIAQLGDSYRALYELGKSKVDEYRFKMVAPEKLGK